MSLRLEKGYGTWFREYRPIYTSLEAGLTSYIKLDHDFIGRAAHETELAAGPARRLVTLIVDPDPDDPADAIGDEPIWHDGAVIGWVTSGGYAHHSRASVALGYVPAHLATPDGNGHFEIELIGRRRPARLQAAPLFDPEGRRMRE
jgi:dimethylglycine dehydrogenase